MKIMRSIFVLFAVLSQTAVVQAQESMRIEHRVASEILEEDRPISVQLPTSYDAGADFSYPVLYLLDGESNIEFSQGVAHFLAENGVIPELIIVGVHSGATRGRDYRPDNPTAGSTTGAADRFLDFLARELVPFVEDNYRAAPLRLISGHSLGGVFVAYAMLERPDLFRGYLTQSPYVVDAVGGPVLAALEQRLAEPASLDAFYYMNIGAEPDLMTGWERMRDLLDGGSVEGFSWQADVEEDENHMTTRLVGLYEGLVAFFSREWAIASTDLTDAGFSGLEGHLAGLAATYGYDVLLGERTFQEAVQTFFAQQDLPSANAGAGLYTTHHPGSPLAWFLLANAAAAGGDRDAGLEAIRTAISLYEADPDPRLRPVYENMVAFRDRLTGG